MKHHAPLVLMVLIAQSSAQEAPIATVIVSAAREPVVTMLDKTVHDVSAAPRAANGSAQDVLQALPGLAVGADGRIAVRGNAQVTVLIDGRPVAGLEGDGRAAALQTMNPHTTRVDAQQRSRGNPAFGPQRHSAWELGASSETATLSTSAAAFYRVSRDVVGEARTVDADGALLTSRRNGGQSRSAGLSGSLDWTLTPVMRVGLDGGVYRVALRAADGEARGQRGGPAGYANLRAAWTAGRDELAFDAHLQPEEWTPLGRYGATSSVNLSWKRRLSATLSLTLNATDLFDGSRRDWRMEQGGLRQSGFEHVVARRVYLGVVKKFEQAALYSWCQAPAHGKPCLHQPPTVLRWPSASLSPSNPSRMSKACG